LTQSAPKSLADLEGGRCAVNDPHSNTGMNLLRAEVAGLADRAPFFAEVIYTGSHAMSAWSVAESAADVASLDAVTFALLQRHRPSIARRLRPLHWTSLSPGLPFVTSRLQPFRVVDALRHALVEAVGSSALKAAREVLLLKGVGMLPDAHYESIASLARAAADRGYPELR
jgi:ABC-type phosphate/phosphonate transport system substrate-binding protein